MGDRKYYSLYLFLLFLGVHLCDSNSLRFLTAGDYSGGYSAQYSVPPPAMASGDNNYSGSGQGYQSSYGSGQNQDWNQQNTGKESIYSASYYILYQFISATY